MDIDQMIAELEVAIASGAKRIVSQSNGVKTEIEYQSSAEMRTTLANLKAQKNKRPRTILVAF